MGLSKTLLFFFNALFVIGGLVLLGLGIWVRVKDNDINSVFGKGGPLTPSNLMIAVGVIIFVVAVFGCLGAIKESKCLLIVFIGFLVVILILEIALVVLAIIYKSEAKTYAKDAILESIKKNYGVSGQDALTKGVDKIQEKWHCCGADNYTDWESSEWKKKNPTLRVPKSCCKNSHAEPNCTLTTTSVNAIYTATCVTELEKWASDNLIIVYGVGIAVAIIEIFGIVLATIVMKNASSDGSSA